MVIWLVPAAFFAIGVLALYDAVQWSDTDWEAAGLRKLSWFLIVGFLGVIGAALYLFRALPRLERVGGRRR